MNDFWKLCARPHLIFTFTSSATLSNVRRALKRIKAARARLAIRKLFLLFRHKWLALNLHPQEINKSLEPFLLSFLRVLISNAFMKNSIRYFVLRNAFDKLSGCIRQGLRRYKNPRESNLNRSPESNKTNKNLALFSISVSIIAGIVYCELLIMKTFFLTVVLFLIVVSLPLSIAAQTSEVLIKQAREAITKQDFPAALAAVETVLKVEPKNDAALAEKARVFYFQKKPAEASKEIESVLAINPRNFVALNLRGSIKNDTKDYEGAVADFSLAIAANPKFTKPYINRARVNIALNAKQDVIVADWLKARELEPKSAFIANEIALYCIEKTDFGCKWEVDEVVKLSPTAPAYFLKGYWFVVKKIDNPYTTQTEAASALADFAKAVELDPKTVNQQNYYGMLGRVHYFAKNYTASIENLNKQIALDAASKKNSTWNYIYRSQTLMAMGNSAAALKDFDELEKIDAKIPQIYLWRGDYFRDIKDYDKALLEYKKFNELFDGSFANWKLAHIYGLKKDYANAETNLKIVWALNNGTRSSWIKNADFRVPNCQKVTLEAEIELNKGNSEKAGSLFYQASNENHDTDTKCMANAAYQQGSLALDKSPWSAIDAFEKAIRLDSGSFPDAQAKLEQAKNKDRKVPTYGSNDGENGRDPFGNLTPEQKRKAADALKKMNADEKKVNETANAIVPVVNRKWELDDSFSKLNDKLQSDTKNQATYAAQMKKDAEEIVMICEQFLSKYGTELDKTDLPSLNAKVDAINEQIREMRTEIGRYKKNIEQLEKIIKGNN